MLEVEVCEVRGYTPLYKGVDKTLTDDPSVLVCISGFGD